MIKNTMTPIQYIVLNHLRKSKTPTPRQELQALVFGTSHDRNHDRTIQHVIHDLREMGFVIVSNSRTPGYKLTTNRSEVKYYAQERMKAARSMMRTARRVMRAYGLRGQIALPKAG